MYGAISMTNNEVENVIERNAAILFMFNLVAVWRHYIRWLFLVVESAVSK